MLEHLAEALPIHFSGQVPQAVVHVGAYTGEEVSFYLKNGFDNVRLIEANPELVTRLHNDFENVPEVQIIHRAVSNVKGIAEFTIHQTEKGGVESSSLLKLKRLGEIVPVFNSEKKVQVATSTLNELKHELNFDLSNCLLCIDIQGAELMALEGASQVLEEVTAVICEVNLIENYLGGAMESEIEAILTESGFSRYFTIYHELYEGDCRFPAWGEGLWIKSR